MKRFILAVVLSVSAALVTGLPAWAHHSFSASYDMSQPITVQGTITQVLLRNPHSWFRLNVKDASGKVEEWSFEAGTPSGMIRNGFKPNTIKSGTEVTVKAIHARDAAQNMGLLQEIVTSDGRTYATFGTQGER